jgi:2-polyprenyl-3-methyl-5-hydroxy-6-metoxy-1,4-benzoquinol methylase
MPTLHRSLKTARGVVDVTLNTVGIRQSARAIADQAQSWWTRPPEHKRSMYCHWRDGFDADTWLAIGRESFDLCQQFARAISFPMPAKRVVEWGCGGGANAVHFARGADAFVGIDVTDENLDECRRQMGSMGLDNFQPVKIDIPDPESALSRVAGPVDLFLCLYVFEVFPSPEYGSRVLRIAHQMLRPGGMAMV